MDKKKLARMEMLRQMSKSKAGEAHKGIGDLLKGKKVQKVSVIAKDEEGLEKGLSKAQQILKAKLGEKLLDDEDEEMEEECEHCAGKGCEECEEEDEE